MPPCAGGVYFGLAFFAFTALTTTDLLMAERRLVAREVHAGCYRPATYLACKAVLDGVLLRVIPVLLYSASFYPMVGVCLPWAAGVTSQVAARAAAPSTVLRMPDCAPSCSRALAMQMGLQGGANHVALFLLTMATFALAVAAFALAVTVGAAPGNARMLLPRSLMPLDLPALHPSRLPAACKTAGVANLLLTVGLLLSLLVGGFLVKCALLLLPSAAA